MNSRSFEVMLRVRSLVVSLLLSCVWGTGVCPASEPPSQTIRIAFGSCAVQWRAQPIWDAIAAQNPDVYLSLGDAIYADWDGSSLVPVTEDLLRAQWNILASRPEFSRFREAVPMLSTWDNHDYGSYEGGIEFAYKEQSREAFLDFWNVPADSPRRHRDGIYTARYIGEGPRRVQILLLDTRWARRGARADERSRAEKREAGVIGRYLPAGQADAGLLSEDQWQWLERELGKPAAVRIIASSIQFVADEKGMDEWGNFPHERERLLDLLRYTRAEHVLIISGNAHFSEISQLEDFDYPLIDFTASGMTPENINPHYADARNSYRVRGPLVDVNFGLITIDWQPSEGARVLLSAHDVQGHLRFEREVKLHELQF